jgi:hypothetical protein
MTPHRTTTRALAAAALALSTSAALADVTLLGDTLSIMRANPTPQTQFLTSIPDTVVTAGPSDQVSWSPYGSPRATFDPEALSIEIQIDLPSGHLGGADFDGYVFTGFSHDITSYTLTHTTAFQTWVSLPDARTLTLNLNGLSRGTLTLGLTLAPPVPEPASVAMLAAGLGLVGATVRRRRRRG